MQEYPAGYLRFSIYLAGMDANRAITTAVCCAPYSAVYKSQFLNANAQELPTLSAAIPYRQKGAWGETASQS